MRRKILQAYYSTTQEKNQEDFAKFLQKCKDFYRLANTTDAKTKIMFHVEHRLKKNKLKSKVFHVEHVIGELGPERQRRFT